MFQKFFAHFVSLPDPLKAGVTAVILTLVSLLFANVVTLIPFLAFLEPYTVPLATAAGMAFIAWFERVIPDAYAAVAISAVQLVLALITVFTGIATYAASNPFPALLAP